MIQLAHPLLLALLPVFAVVLWLAQRRSLAAQTRTQRIVCTALRAFILLLLTLAIAGLRLLLPSREAAVIFAVDASASVSPEAQQQARAFVGQALHAQKGGDQAGVVGFAEGAGIWQPPQARTSLASQWPGRDDKGASDLAHALDFSAAILPASGSRRVVLLSDGNETRGDATAAASRLAGAAVEVWTVPLRNETRPEVLVERVEMPRRLKTGEVFDLTAKIRSNLATTAQVKLYQNQFLIETRDVELKAGVNDFRVPNLHAEGTFVSYEVEVAAVSDTSVENNRAVATASIRGQPRVLLVESDVAQTRALAEALRAEKIVVDTRGPGGVPQAMEDLQQYDLFILSDVPSLRLSREQMELTRRWVQELGGGFVMLGGENSYGVGGYYRTPIEQMLPVRMEHEDRQDTPSVALLVVLDRSGSMAAQVQGQTKMSLADQGAVFAMNALQPKDYFGVLAVDTRSHVVAPLAQLSARQANEQKIMSVTAGGGGIYIYTSLAEAFQVMRDVSARIKHIILFSDAADAEEKAAGEMADGARSGGNALDLASAMVSAKITTSVVGLGTEQDKDTVFLRQLAERGNGRFYLTSDATNLPQIFSTETMRVAQSSLVEEPFLAVPATKSPLIAGLDWAQSPLLLGYNATKAKPTADLLLATERGDPLLATWRYGLGQTGAFTSDAKSRWAADWLTWPGYGKFWAQLVRGLMRHGDQGTFQIGTREEGDDLLLTIDAVTPEGAFRNRMPVQVHAVLPNGESLTETATQQAPGRYTAKLHLPAEGTTVLSIASPELPDGAYVFGHTRSYPREFLTTDTNEKLLRAIAEAGRGQFDPKPEGVFAASAVSAKTVRDVSDYLLMAVLCLIPLDIWLRRRSWREATSA
jgi:uncharacterized membrane protein